MRSHSPARQYGQSAALNRHYYNIMYVATCHKLHATYVCTYHIFLSINDMLLLVFIVAMQVLLCKQ